MDKRIFEAIADKATDAVIVADFNGDIIYWNETAQAIFGYTSDEVYGKYVHDVLPINSLRDKANESFEKFQQAGGNGPLIGKGIHVQGLTKAGRVVHVHFCPNTVDIDGETYIFAFIREITELIKLQDKLKHQSLTDDLTQVFNRRAFMKIANKVFRHAQRHHEQLSLLLFDIDNFKQVNDTHGHHVGDDVIKAVAKHVEQDIRDDDILGRVGGEEFYLALPKTSLTMAIEIAERIRKSLAQQKISTFGKELTVTISIGATTLMPHDSFLQMQQRSDKALYQAKNLGRNQTQSF